MHPFDPPEDREDTGEEPSRHGQTISDVDLPDEGPEFREAVDFDGGGGGRSMVVSSGK